MPIPTERMQKLLHQRDALKSQIHQISDFRPGSLVERYRRCGKSGCHCAREGAAGHGPTWSLTREVGGKTVTKTIPPDAVEATRRQLVEHRRFRALVRELIETNEQLCDARLTVSNGPSPAGAKKGASKKRLTPPSSPRLKPS